MKDTRMSGLKHDVVVTSFGNDGFFTYGKRFIETFFEFWPCSVQLVVYHEGLPGEQQPRPPECPNGCTRDVVYRNLLLHAKECRDFLARHASDEWTKGTAPPKGRLNEWVRKAPYNFRFDAYKFARKVFAARDAAERMGGVGRLIWLDADVYTYRKVHPMFFDWALPRGVTHTFLGRDNYHSECGFVAYRLPDMLAFIREFARLYSSGDVFDLQEWHDSWVFDWLRLSMAVPGARDISNTRRGNVWEHSELAKTMTHLKGALKYKEGAP